MYNGRIHGEITVTKADHAKIRKAIRALATEKGLKPRRGQAVTFPRNSYDLTIDFNKKRIDAEAITAEEWIACGEGRGRDRNMVEVHVVTVDVYSEASQDFRDDLRIVDRVKKDEDLKALLRLLDAVKWTPGTGGAIKIDLEIKYRFMDNNESDERILEAWNMKTIDR